MNVYSDLGLVWLVGVLLSVPVYWGALTSYRPEPQELPKATARDRR